MLHKENWTREVTFSLKKFEKSLIRALKVGTVFIVSITRRSKSDISHSRTEGGVYRIGTVKNLALPKGAGVFS